MNKLLSIFMVSTLMASQLSGVISGTTMLASEIEQTKTVSATSEVSSDETTSLQEAEIGSEEISKKDVLESETTSEEEVESTIETTSAEEVKSAEVTSTEATSEEEVESESEVASEDNSDISIEAKITIDDNGAVNKVKSASTTPEGENVTASTNEARLAANAGESKIDVTPTTYTTGDSKKAVRASSNQFTDQEVYYTLDDEGNIISGSLNKDVMRSSSTSNEATNTITVYNNTIVDADTAIARTSGGYDSTFYMYDSIEDLKSGTDGVSMSGGGFDATFIESVKQDDEYYFHIKISGYEGYVSADDMQLIPNEYLQARSYYQVEDGDWVYYSAIDPLTSTDYDVMEIGEAPTDAVVGTKYYSDDDINYYTDENITANSTSSVTYNSYFMNLPFRSESDYTATDFKNYLNAKGKTNSQYYTETSAFVKAQEYEGTNALMLFAMANHESAYGTSSYANACYNFFGRGAIDSDPNQACEYYSYPTATDGILAQALFLENGYFDILDWRYSGTNVGNKASGMNVKYASDPDWGKKISNHAYMMDQYGQKSEEDEYSILQVTGVKHVYTTSDLSTNVKSSSESESLSFYDLSQMVGTSNTINVIADAKMGDAYRIQVPTSVKQTLSSTCSYTNSMSGSYPNYGGRSNVSVSTNTANYSCAYENYEAQKYWISTSNTEIIEGPSIEETDGVTYKYEYYDNGSKKYRYTIDVDTNEVTNAIRYNTSGQIINRYTYKDGATYGSQGKYMEYKFYINPSSQYLTKAEKYNNGKTIYSYTYNSETKYEDRGSNMKYRFALEPSTGYVKSAVKFSGKNIVTRYLYEDKTSLSETGSKMTYRFNINASKQTVSTADRLKDGEVVNKYTYRSGAKYGEHGKYMEYKFTLDKDGNVLSGERYDSNRKLANHYTYYANTSYAEKGSGLKYKYWYKTGTSYITQSYTYDQDRKLTKIYLYEDNTKLSGSGRSDWSMEFFVNNDYIINYAYEYSDGKRAYKITYESGTKFTDDFENKVANKTSI